MDDAERAHDHAATLSWSDFGLFLQHLRRRRGLSQERLAESLACHRTYIWRLEHGQNRPSRLFLRSLTMACAPTAEETAVLLRFAQMREFRIVDLDVTP